MAIKIDNKIVRKLYICSAFYEVKAYSPYIVSLVETIRTLTLLGIPWEYKEISGDSYVDRAKNSLLNAFLDDQEATHLFMIDSDQSWTPDSFIRVLRAAMLGAELVGGSYPCKNNWDFFGCIPKMEDDGNGNLYHLGKEIEIEADGGTDTVRLLEMHCIPGGFICYSKAALKRAEPNLKTYHCIEVGKTELISQIEFFRCNIEADGGRIGEDVYFQKRFQEAGGVVYLEPNCTIGHYGINRWLGNYHEKLLMEKRVRDAGGDLEANLGNLEKFAANLKERAAQEAKPTCACA